MIGAQIAGLLAPQGVAPFDPNSISGLRLWYDASDSSTLTMNGSRVSAITNKATSYPLTLVQATAGQQPLLVANSQGGKQVLQLTNARADGLRVASGNPMAGGTTQTLFLVYKSTSTTNGYKFSYGVDGGGTLPLMYQLSSHNYYESGSGQTSVQGTYNVVNTANIMTLTQSTGGAPTLKTIIGGTTQETVTGSSGSWSIGTPNSTVNIGFQGTYSPTDFNFCEVLAYNNVLGTTDFNAVVSYLTAKWSV